MKTKTLSPKEPASQLSIVTVIGGGGDEGHVKALNEGREKLEQSLVYDGLWAAGRLGGDFSKVADLMATIFPFVTQKVSPKVSPRATNEARDHAHL